MLMTEMKSLGEWAEAGEENDYFVKSLAEVKRFVDETLRTEVITGRDYDGIEARLAPFMRTWHSEWVGYRRKGSTFPKEELTARREALKQNLDDFIQAAGADFAPLLRDEMWAMLEQYRASERSSRLPRFPRPAASGTGSGSRQRIRAG